MTALTCTRCGGPRSNRSRSGLCRPCHWATQGTSPLGMPATDTTRTVIDPDTAHAAALTVAEHVPPGEVRDVLRTLGLNA